MKRATINTRRAIRLLSLSGISVCLTTIAGCIITGPQASAGTPYLKENPAMQVIPGIIQCEYYDLGGEGVAYHDIDANQGSGGLNKGEGYLNRFRIDEGVDISYTKFHDSIDNSAYNMVPPEEGKLYVGWTEPGEYIHYTVEVKKSGNYFLSVMYTSRYEGQFSLSSSYSAVVDTFLLESTYNEKDPIAWRQWHHWNYAKHIGTINLKKGKQTLTLSTLGKGNMNYDFLSFSLKDK